MSETETETQTEPEPEQGSPESAPEQEEANPDTEPEEPIEGDDEDADEAEEAPAEDPEAQAVMSAKARKQRDDKLDREKERHAGRIGEIMGDEATALIPCPVCMDGIDGWIFEPEAQQLPAEAIARIRQVIGLPDYSTFMAAKDAITCPDCGGLGEVTTGSHVPGYEVKSCGLCGKKGWIGVGAQLTNGHVEETTGEIITGPTVYQGEAEDPEIAHLRQRGFTVIPPMQVQAG